MHLENYPSLRSPTVSTDEPKKKGDGTLMTLVHSGLPDDDSAKSHEKGWNYFLDLFPNHFGAASSAK
jgi:hypothetical protein